MSTEADEAAFLEAIARDPDDEAGRLVYADFLEDRGDAARAEYVRGEAAWRRLTQRYAALAATVDPAWLAAIGRTRAVLLTSVGARFIECIAEVRRATGLGLAEAKAIVDAVRAGTPRVVVEGVDAEVAERVARQFAGLGEARIIVGSPARGERGR
jgi:uncharacterized protein (TIGR02996 family)